jgi:hypothetical protein
MKTPILIFFLLSVTALKAQTLVGQWQLMKESTCAEDDIDMSDTDAAELVGQMKSMSSGGTPQIIQFKENLTAEESTKIISKKKSYNSKSFMYKFNGTSLYLLDKKSHTIIEGFTVEKLDADSLIISNASRACETKFFVRIK